MKKIILIQILIFSFFFSIAQQEKNNPASLQNKSTSVSSFPVVIGQTTHDMQSYASVRRQSYYYPNGTVGAVFNFDISFALNFPPAITLYNYYDGTAWGPLPISPDTIQPFGSLDRLSNGTEAVISFDSTAAGGLRIDTANVPGSANWAGIALPPEPNGHQCSWPHIAVGGANGMSIHVIALTEPIAFGGFSYSGVDGMLTYSRSEDGGATWNITYATLPGWNASVTARMYPDEYNIDAKGNTVAITSGGRTNDWVMWKSTDNGTTFTKTTIKAFPIPAYDEFTMISDTNSNGIADSLLVPDGSMAVLIDNNGLVHCWSGNVGILDNVLAAEYQNVDLYGGLSYWNENMGSASPVEIMNALDLDASGTLDIVGVAKYGVGVCSMPSAGIDINNKIYVCYSSIVENTTNGAANEQGYRNVSAMYSQNSGASWATPVFLAQDDFSEQVFPYMTRDVDSTLKIICQQDAEPGMAVWGDMDPFVLNDILCFELDTALYGPGVMGNISGLIYFDENNNNVFDGIDNGAGTVLVSVNGIGTYSYNGNGNYSSFLVYGNNLIEPYSLPSYFSSTPANVSYNVSVPSFYTQDFALHAIAPYDSATVFINFYDAYCFAQADYLPIINNYGTTAKDYVLKFHPDPVLPTPVNVVPPPDSIVNGDYYFSINGIAPLAQNNTVGLSIVTPGPGVPVTIYADLYENNLGVLTYLHSDTISKIISCSYDPNDKTARPEGEGAQHYTLLNQNLEYVIRFQNTGNDTAFNVMILDTLDANFNINTFQLLHASHPCTVEILAGNILRFHFKNIYLPDSIVNEPASHGFIHYRIRHLAGTAPNTVVYNTANIYFDFNVPVATNTTFNTLVNVIPSGIDLTGFQNEINIIPNPFSESTQLIFNNNRHDLIRINLYDISGRVIKSYNTSESKFILNTSDIEKGIYILRLSNSAKEEHVAKLVKQ